MALISVTDYPVRIVLKILLQDKTTKHNILFATKAYTSLGSEYQETSEISTEKIVNMNLLPRVEKELEHQQARTKAKAEVFTPSWICNKMNNHCDEEWFGRKDVFNTEIENGWIANQEPVDFGKLSWKKYVDSRRIEITCGEAPYLVSRYDTTTGEIIPIPDRIGLLDRKLRVVDENVEDDKDWLKWTERAFQSVYGYEFQGDNLLIARINLLNTYVDYYEARLENKPGEKELRKIANIISWNIWQMDGLTGTIPFSKPKKEFENISFFDLGYLTPNCDESSDMTRHDIDESVEMQICKIFDWRSNKSIPFDSIKEKQ